MTDSENIRVQVPKAIKKDMLDHMANSKRYRSQSDFIQRAIEEKIERERKNGNEIFALQHNDAKARGYID